MFEQNREEQISGITTKNFFRSKYIFGFYPKKYFFCLILPVSISIGLILLMSIWFWRIELLILSILLALPSVVLFFPDFLYSLTIIHVIEMIKNKNMRKGKIYVQEVEANDE